MTVQLEIKNLNLNLNLKTNELHGKTEKKKKKLNLKIIFLNHTNVHNLMFRSIWCFTTCIWFWCHSNKSCDVKQIQIFAAEWWEILCYVQLTPIRVLCWTWVGFFTYLKSKSVLGALKGLFVEMIVRVYQGHLQAWEFPRISPQCADVVMAFLLPCLPISLHS